MLIYIGNFRFPDQDAASKRVSMNIKSIKSTLDLEMHVISMASMELKKGVIDGVNYNTTGELCYGNGVKKVFKMIFCGWKTLYLLTQYRNRKIRIIAYNPSLFLTLGLIIFSVFFKFKVILDITEWYQSDHLPFGKYGPFSIGNYIKMHFAYKFFDQFICISDFLEKFYKSKENVVVNIPPLINEVCKDAAIQKSSVSNCVRIVFAGNAGKKDRLIDAIKGVELALNLGVKTEFYIAGPSEKEVRTLISILDINEKNLPKFIILGRISSKEVKKLYDKCHFSIIIRDDLRYAQAGFPTKSIESWSHGVPIITNNVGDISKFSKGCSYVVDSDISESISRMLLTLTQEDYDCLVKGAIATASKFCIESYSSELRKVLI